MSNRWDWSVTGYAGAKHPAVLDGRAKFGDMLLQTVHKGDHSKDMEVEVWRTRIAKGEASRVEVRDLHKGTTETFTK